MPLRELWLYTSRRKWTSLAGGFSLLVPPGFLAEQFTKSFSRATGMPLAVAFEEQDQNLNKWTCWILKLFITSFMIFRYGFICLQLNMCSLRTCLAYTESVLGYRKLCLKVVTCWATTMQSVLVLHAVKWGLVLGPEVPERAGRCSIPELDPPPCPAQPVGKHGLCLCSAFLVMLAMKC